MRLVMPRMSAHVKSATASVSTSGVFVTTTFRRHAAATSMLLNPTATFATTRSASAASRTSRSITSVIIVTSPSLPRTRPSNSVRGSASRSSWTSTSQWAVSSLNADGAIVLRVTSTRGRIDIGFRWQSYPVLAEVTHHSGTATQAKILLLKPASGEYFAIRFFHASRSIEDRTTVRSFMASISTDVRHELEGVNLAEALDGRILG